MPVVWYLDIGMLFTGPGQSSAGEPRCQKRPEARQHSDHSSTREAMAEGSLGLSVQPNLHGEFWAIKRPGLKSKAGLGGGSVIQCLPCKLKDQTSDHEYTCKSWVGMVTACGPGTSEVEQGIRSSRSFSAI